MDADDDSDKGICILSLDSGGPGTYSQLLLVKEYMCRLTAGSGIGADDLYPADYFDMMGGVGFGGLVAFMLGHLRMTTYQAIDALLTIASAIFPYDPGNAESPESNLQNLKVAIEDLLEARNIPPETKMNDKRFPPMKCRVVVYTATSTDITQPRIIRTYSHRGSSFNPTIVESLCATMATPSYFTSVKAGSRGREQTFAGGPLGANNPTRELLREAGTIFGNGRRVAQVISIGAGWESDAPINPMDTENAAGQWLNYITTDCETVASELSTRLFTVDAYVRLNVNIEMGAASMNDWTGLSAIESQTSAYLETAAVARTFEMSLQYLRSRVGTATLGQINQATNSKAPVKVAPALSPHLVPRDKPWRKMVHHLIDQPSSNQRVFVITGMGGCGKTQMVSYFLQGKGSQWVNFCPVINLMSDQISYKHAIFVDASSSFTVKADLQAWAQSLGDEHEQDVWEDALRVLTSDIYDGNWILILDNADNPTLDLGPFLPKCYKGAILITSRNRHIGYLSNTHHLELGEMEKDEALSTLLRAARRDIATQSSKEIMVAQTLAEKLGYLAVALVQAGTYCHQLSTVAHTIERPFTFAQYTSIFSSQRAELLKKPESSSLDNYQLGAYTAFDISYNSISPTVQNFFHFISSFHYSNISLALFAAAAERGFRDPEKVVPRPEGHKAVLSELETLLCLEGRWNEIHVHRIIHTLRSFSLVSASSTANMVFLHIHPVVHAWARDMLPSNDQHYRRMATQVLTCCSTQGPLPLRRYLVPHIHYQLDDDITSNSLHINDRIAFAFALKAWGFYDKAEGLFMRSLEIARELYGNDSPFSIAVSAMLAQTYHHHGKWDKAEALFVETYEQCVRLKGKDHPDAVLMTESLAGIYSDRGMHKEAEELKLGVLQYRIKGRGMDHPSALSAANNLARTYADQGRYEEAEELQFGALEQRRRLLGNNHPDTVSAANNLASTYHRQGRHKEAETLNLYVLEQSMKILGEDHPGTISAMNNLAGTYNAQGRHKEAEPLIVDVMEKVKRVMGPEHPRAILAMSNLAVTYVNLGELDKAEPLLYEAVTLGVKVLGKDHPETKRYATKLARVLTELEAFEDAEGIRSLFL